MTNRPNCTKNNSGVCLFFEYRCRVCKQYYEFAHKQAAEGKPEFLRILKKHEQKNL